MDKIVSSNVKLLHPRPERINPAPGIMTLNNNKCNACKGSGSAQFGVCPFCNGTGLKPGVSPMAPR